MRRGRDGGDKRRAREASAGIRRSSAAGLTGHLRRAGDPPATAAPYDRVVTRLAARVSGFPHGLAARVAALPPQQQERVQDALLAVALAGVNVVSVLPYHGQLHPLWLALVLLAAQGIPLAWRRRWPVPVLNIIAAARVTYDQIGFGFAPLPLGPAIAVYTVVDRRGPVWRWLTAAGVVTGIAISESAPGHQEPYDAIFQVMIFATAWAAGVLSRA